MTTATTEPAAVTAARELRARGIGIVWILPNEKRPTEEGWTKRSQEPEDYTPGANLGILTGRLSRDLVCVDLDAQAAIQTAWKHLPETGMIEGRPGKIDSHLYYRVTGITAALTSTAAGGMGGPKILHYRDATDKGILDILGTGAQAVGPPSLHPSGERRAWSGGVMGEPATVDCAELYAAVERLAKDCGWAPPPPPAPRPTTNSHNRPDVMERGRKYLASCPPAIQGSGGSDQTLAVARAIVYGLDLGVDAGLDLMLAHYNQRCVPPWSEAELLHKCEDADRLPFNKPRGWLLNEERADGGTRNPRKPAKSGGVVPSKKGYATKELIEKDVFNGDVKKLGAVAEFMGRVPQFVDDYDVSWEMADGRIETRHIERRPDKLFYWSNPTAQNQATDPATNAVAASPPGTPNEAVDDPHRLARLFRAERCTRNGEGTLQFHRDEFHRHDGAAYRPVPDKELRADVTAIIKREFDRQNIEDQTLAPPDQPRPTVKKISGPLVANVINALASETILSGRIDPPCWLDGAGEFPADEILPCLDALVHLPSFAAGKATFSTPPTPRFFSPFCLGFNFGSQVPEPTAWLGFLNDLFPGDPQSIEVLQDWFGYALTPDTRQQKILMVVGPKRSGKGTIARVVRGLIGSDNIVGPTLSSLSTNFGVWPLVGKSVAMIQDARLSGRTDIMAIVERLLSISGEDALTIDRKNLPPITTQLKVRFAIFTNELPKLADSSGALAGRMIVLRLTQSWFGREDRTLTARLMAERQGILRWAIQGWARLQERGRFIQPDSAKEMLGELEDLSSPIGAFVRDCCVVGTEHEIERGALYELWKNWCKEEGKEHAGDRATFGRNLRAAVPAISDKHGRTAFGREWLYIGIGRK